MGQFVKVMEGLYKDYSDPKNQIEIESVYDLLHQTMMDGKFRLYIKEYFPREPLPNDDISEILDI